MAVTLTNSQVSAGLYSAFWNRAPDATGQNFWVGKLNAGTLTTLQVATEFYNAPEGLAAYPNWMRPYANLSVTDPANVAQYTKLVTEVYNSVFERAPDATGLAFYVNQMKGGVSFPQVVLNMMTNAVNSAAAGNTDGQQFLNEIQVGIYVSETLRTDDPAITSVALDGVTYQQSSVAVREAELYAMVNPGETRSLTTGADRIYGIDNVTVNGDLVNASASGVQTFQSWDTIEGGAGTNTLNVQMNGTAVAPTLANIQAFNVADAGGAFGAGNANVIGLSGLNSLQTFNYLGGGGGSGITLNDINSLPTVSISNTGGPNTLRFVDAALAGTNALNMTLTGTTGGVQTISKTNGTNALETINLTAKGGNVAGGLVVTNMGATKLNIAAFDNLTLGAIIDGSAVQTLKTVDASGSLGNVTLSAVANSTVTGGTGNDTLTSQGGTLNNFDGGAGNDTFIFNNGLSATDTITGGLGNNTLQSTSAALVGYVAPASATITGITALQVSDALNGAIDPTQFGGNITSVSLLGGTSFAGPSAVTLGAGSATLNVGSAIAFVNLNNTLTINDTGTAITDVLSLNNANPAGVFFDVFNGQNLNINGYETVNADTGLFAAVPQTVGAITLAADVGGTTVLNLTGANGLTTGVLTANSINAAALGGALTMLAASVGATSITGTAYSDTLVGNVATANSIVGGDGNDTISGGAAADNLSGGLGNDQFVMGAGALTNTDTIDGGAGTNALNAVSADLGAVTAAANANLTNIQSIQVSDSLANNVNLANIGSGVANIELQNDFGIFPPPPPPPLPPIIGNLNVGGETITGMAGTLTVGLGTATSFWGDNLGGALTFADTGSGTSDSVVLVNRQTNAAIFTGAFTDVFNGAALSSNGYENVTLNTGSVATIAQTVGAIAINPDVATTSTSLTLAGANGVTVANITGTPTGTVTVNASGLTTTGLTLTTTGSIAAVTGSGVADNITLGAFAGTVDGGSGNDTITGGGAVVSLVGGSGNDTIATGGGNATVHGGDGNDTITGGAGNDSIDAGSGNDSIIFATGNLTALDTIDGGTGVNTLSADDTDLSALGVVARTTVDNIQTVISQTALTAGTTINLANIDSSINRLNLNGGTLGAGSLVGNAGALTVGIGLAGLVPGALGGALTVRDTGTAVTDSLTLINSNTNVGGTDAFGGFNVTSTGYENVTINTGTVPVVGGQNIATLLITPDTASAASTVTVTGSDTLNITLLSTGTSTGRLTVDGSALGTGAALNIVGTAQGATGTASITGSNAADTITVGAFASTIIGGYGNDILTGGTAADLLDGGAGNDSLTAGGGNDTMLGGAGNDTIVGAAGTVSIDGGAGNDLVNVGNGLSAADVIDGGSGINTLLMTTPLIAAYAGATNFQVLQLDSAANVTQNMANFTANTFGEVDLNGAVIFTVTNVADGTELSGLNNSTIVATHAANTSNNSLTISGFDDPLLPPVPGPVTLAAVTANQTDTLSFTAGDVPAGSALTVTSLNSIDVDTINISGVANQSITIAADGLLTGFGAGATARTVAIDASANSGTVFFDASLVGAVPGSLVNISIQGSTAAANTILGTNNADTIVGGIANDTLTGEFGADTFNLSSGGNDTLVYTAQGQTATAILAAPGGVLVGADVVTGGSAGDLVTAYLGLVGAVSATLLTGAEAAGTTAAVLGNYNSLTGAWANSATGSDTLVEFFDGAGNVENIVFVGFQTTGAAATAGGNFVLG